MTALSPDQLADLRRSGLTDSTIELMQCAGVRPKEIPIKSATSAYSIPYFRLDGTLNCFSRIKIVPEVVDASGKKMKYWQPKGSLPHLYCPPLLNWQTVAKHPRTELTITEGEKKAAAACQHGLITAAVGGVWCHTATLDNGDKLTLPMLEEFQWDNRPVLMCPDSDAWKEEKGWNILAGFFALAKDLQHHGADVRFVRLPDLHGRKAGLDDWLLVSGNDVEHGWPKLERISLDDDRFNSLTAWWQKRKEKQVTQAAIQQHDADDLEITEAAGLYTVRSPKHSVTMVFDRLTDAHGKVKAELMIMLGMTELLPVVDVGLKSDMEHTKLASSLKSLAPATPWKLLLQRACSLVLKQHRLGEPPTRLTKDSTVAPLTYSVNPIVFKGKTTICYGDGGLGKSTLALVLAMGVSVGRSLAGLSALQGRALFLDYEDDVDVHARRLHAIQAGHPDLLDADVLYQRCVEPLTKIIHPLVRRIQQDHITFIVLDSLMASTGGDATAEGTAKLFAALRLLNSDVLALGHVPKTQPEGQERTTVYGSVFNQNFARSVWELKKEQEVGDDTAILGLFNRKSNLSRLHLPIGLKVTQNVESTRIQYESFDLSQGAELKKALPRHNRIRTLLEDGEPRTSRDIAEALGDDLESVKATLSNPKFKGIKWHMIGENRGAKWTVINR